MSHGHGSQTSKWQWQWSNIYHLYIIGGANPQSSRDLIVTLLYWHRKEIRYELQTKTIHVYSVFIIDLFFEIFRSFLRKVPSTNNLATLIPPHLELHESKNKMAVNTASHSTFFVFSSNPTCFCCTSINQRVSCPYIVDRIFDAVPTKDFT